MPYAAGLHTSFVIAFLAFAALFVAVHGAGKRS
jgi:hypothetical protein